MIRTISVKRPRGFTLLEMITAVGCTSVLLAAIGSAFLLASRSVPDSDHPVFQATRASRALEEIAEEIRTCRHISEATSSALTLVCDDRNGDGVPEVIRYHWAGSGAGLMRSVNGVSSSAILKDLADFQFAYRTRTANLTISAPPQVGPLVTVSRFHQGTATTLQKVQTNYTTGQYFYPSLPAGAVAWKMEYILYKARRSGDTGQTNIGLHYANPDRSPGTLIQRIQKPPSQLSWSANWEMDLFDSASSLPVDSGYCVVFSCPEGTPTSAWIEYDPTCGAYRQYSNDEGSTWTTQSSGSLTYYVYGRAYLPGAQRQISRTFFTRIGLSASPGPDDSFSAHLSVRPENAPERLEEVWEARFDGDPTQQDFSRDGADFVMRDGSNFQTSGLSDGVWSADGVLDTSGKCDFDRPTICELRFQAASTHSGGAVFWINADASAGDGKFAPIYLKLVLEANGTQTLSLCNKTSNTTATVLKKVGSLPGRMIDVRLVIDPDLDAVNLRVEGQDCGTFSYTRISPSFDDRFASVLSGGAVARFDSIRVLVLP